MPADWRDNAACRNMSPNQFMVGKGDPGLRAALDTCATCPVQPDCLADLLAHRPPYGIDVGVRAGLTARGIKRARRQHAAMAAAS